MQETEKEEVSMRYLTCLFLFVFLISAFGQVANTEEQYQKMYKKYSGYFHLQRARYLLDYPGATFIYKDDLKLFFSKLPEERYLKAAAEANLAIENPNGLEEEDLKFVKYLKIEAMSRLYHHKLQTNLFDESAIKQCFESLIKEYDRYEKEYNDQHFLKAKLHFLLENGHMLHALRTIMELESAETLLESEIYKLKADVLLIMKYEKLAGLKRINNTKAEFLRETCPIIT